MTADRTSGERRAAGARDLARSGERDARIELVEYDPSADHAALKRELARRMPDDREAYTAAKTTFVRRVDSGGER